MAVEMREEGFALPDVRVVDVTFWQCARPACQAEGLFLPVETCRSHASRALSICRLATQGLFAPPVQVQSRI